MMTVYLLQRWRSNGESEAPTELYVEIYTTPEVAQEYANGYAVEKMRWVWDQHTDNWLAYESETGCFWTIIPKEIR